MVRSIISVLFILLSSFCLKAEKKWVPAGDPLPIISRFNEVNADVVSIRCTFIQEKYVDILEDKAISEGKYCYSAPDTVVISYISPESYTISVIGNELSFSSEGKTTTRKVSSDRRFSMLMDLMRTGGVPSSGEVSSYRVEAYDGGDEYRLDISSSKSKGADLEVIIDKEDMSLVSFRMKEGGADYTMFIFKDKQIKFRQVQP